MTCFSLTLIANGYIQSNNSCWQEANIDEINNFFKSNKARTQNANHEGVFIIMKMPSSSCFFLQRRMYNAEVY